MKQGPARRSLLRVFTTKSKCSAALAEPLPATGVSWNYAHWTTPTMEHQVTPADRQQCPWYGVLEDAVAAMGKTLEPEIFPGVRGLSFCGAGSLEKKKTRNRFYVDLLSLHVVHAKVKRNIAEGGRNEHKQRVQAHPSIYFWSKMNRLTVVFWIFRGDGIIGGGHGLNGGGGGYFR